MVRSMLARPARRALCSAGGAAIGVMQVFKISPASVPAGAQPRMLFPEGRPRSAEASAALLSEAAESGDVVLVSESALQHLFGGGNGPTAPHAIGDGSLVGPALLGNGATPGGENGDAVAAAAAAAAASPTALALHGDATTLPAMLSEHGVALADALAASSPDDPDWGSTRAWRQAERGTPTGAQRQLLHAATDGDASALESLLPQLDGDDLAAGLPPSGATALHLAAASGEVRAVALLLSAGCAVHARAANGSTALHWAAGGGHAEVVRALLRAGASPDARSSTWFSTVRGDASGQTAAHWAASGGHTEALEVLLAARPGSLLQRDEREMSPAGAAAAAGHGWLTASLERLEREVVVPVRVVREAVLQRPLGAAAGGKGAGDGDDVERIGE